MLTNRNVSLRNIVEYLQDILKGISYMANTVWKIGRCIFFLT